MCITSVSKYKCSDNTVLLGYIINDWVNFFNDDEKNCTKSDEKFFTVTEIDAIRNIHHVSYNISIEDLENLDPAQFPFPNTLWLMKPTLEIVLKTLAFAPIVFGGIFLNILILMTIIKNRWLWSPSNYLIANVALVDICSLIFGPWMLLINEFFQTYILGKLGCRVEGYTQGAMLLAGVGAVMLVSYDRLAAVALASEARITRKTAPRLIAFTWILACGLSLPLALYRQYRERQWLDYLEKYCYENITILPCYWHVLIAVLVWFPLSVMTITYGTILWRLEHCARELAKRGGGVCVIRARTKAVWIAAAVLMTFLTCRIPFTVLVYWRNNLIENSTINSVDGSFQIMWFISHYLMYLNCAVNPLIYGFTNEKYRRAMDKTPFVSWFKFGSWCCIFKEPRKNDISDKGTSEKLAVIEVSPQPNLKFQKIIKSFLHLKNDQDNFTLKTDIKDGLTPIPSRVMPLDPNCFRTKL